MDQYYVTTEKKECIREGNMQEKNVTRKDSRFLHQGLRNRTPYDRAGLGWTFRLLTAIQERVICSPHGADIGQSEGIVFNWGC